MLAARNPAQAATAPSLLLPQAVLPVPMTLPPALQTALPLALLLALPLAQTHLLPPALSSVAALMPVGAIHIDAKTKDEKFGITLEEDDQARTRAATAEPDSSDNSDKAVMFRESRKDIHRDMFAGGAHPLNPPPQVEPESADDAYIVELPPDKLLY